MSARVDSLETYVGVPATAAILRSVEAQFSLEEVTLPPLTADEVLVRIVAVGMCHTDLLPRLGFAPLPLVLGHEGAGVVEQVGAAVVGIAEGDHVVLSFDSCNVCRMCRSGAPAYCYDFRPRNTGGVAPEGAQTARDSAGATVHHRWFGQSSFATKSIATSRSVVKVDTDLPLELLAPLGCGIQTGAGAMLNVLSPLPGDRVGVFGGGSVGMAAVLAARAIGASEIVVVEENEYRRERAVELGATRAIAPSEHTATEILETVGWLDGTLDTTGAAEAIQAAVRSLHPLGTCGLVSWRDPEAAVSPMDLVMEGRRVVGICEGNAEPRLFIPRMINMWRQGIFAFDALIGSFAFDEINQAEQAMHDGSVIKPVLVM